MSLKAFHIAFIIASAAMSVTCAILLLTIASDESWAAAGASGSVIGAIALAIYGRAFLRKISHLTPRP